MEKLTDVLPIQRSRIASIQGLRGVAACLVAAMHCLSSKGGLTDSASELRHQTTMVFCAVGGAGVDIFFVISGFIILSLAERRVRTQSGWRAAFIFLLRRLGRIYPLYWVTLGVVLVAASWVNRGNPQYHTSVGIREMFLLTSADLSQPPAWTLAFELWFYVGAAILMLLPFRLFAKALLVWATIQASLLIFGHELHIGARWYMFVQPQIMDFFLGCLVAHVCRRRLLLSSWSMALLIGTLGIFLAGCAICYSRLPTGSLFPVERLVLWGAPAAGMIWAVVSLELKSDAHTPVWLQRLGDVSYSIYLWHYTVIAVAFAFGFEAMIQSHKLLQASAEFLATLLIAPLSYRLIELPAMRLIRNNSDRRKPT